MIRRPALHRKHSGPVLVNSHFVHDLFRGDKLSRASVTSVFVEGLRSGLRWFNLAVGLEVGCVERHCEPGRRARKALPDAPPVLTAVAKTLELQMLETAQAAVAKRHTTWLPQPDRQPMGAEIPSGQFRRLV